MIGEFEMVKLAISQEALSTNGFFILKKITPV